jgi:hypothetical protein
VAIADRVRTRVAGWLAPALAADVIVETAPAREPVAVARQGFEYGVPRPVINEVYSGLGASTQSDRRTCSRSTRHACPGHGPGPTRSPAPSPPGGLTMDWDADTGEGSDGLGQRRTVLIYGATGRGLGSSILAA